MPCSNDNAFCSTATCLGKIELQLYCATVRSTHFVRKSVYKCVDKKDIASDCGIRECFQKALDFDQIPRGRQDEYYLTIQLGGEITSIDEIVFQSCHINREEVHIGLMITKVESQDGVPAPIEVFILVPLNETITARRKLTIEFSGYYRSFEGEVSSLEDAPVEAVSVVFLKD